MPKHGDERIFKRESVDINDNLFGTKRSGGNRSKNFSVESLIALCKKVILDDGSGDASISPLGYKFAQTLEKGVFTANNTNLTDITEITISVINNEGKDLTPLLNLISANLEKFSLGISVTGNPNFKSAFKIESKTDVQNDKNEIIAYKYTVKTQTEFTINNNLIANNAYNLIFSAIAEGGGGKLSADIKPTVSIGGINASNLFPIGTPIESIIRKMLVKYLAPRFTRFSLNASKTNPIAGEEMSISTATIDYVLDSDGKTPINVTISGDGFNKSVDDGIKSLTVAQFTVKKNGGALAQWTLSGKDKNGVSISTAKFTITWFNQFLFGAHTEVLNSNNFQRILDSLKTKKSVNGKSTTVKANADNNNKANYTYLAYPSLYGELQNVILNGTTPVLGAFKNIGNFSWKNANNLTISMIVYRANAKGAFSDGNTIKTQ